MNEVYTITSDSGDEYKLQFTTDRSGVIADALLNFLESKGIEVVEIGLARVKGQNVTNHHVLGQIEECVADLLRKHQNVILSFFCDFIHFIPSKKRIPVQEYRSRLFSAMFDRYVAQHDQHDLCNHVVEVEGVSEPFFFHVIYRKEHEVYADMIAEGHQKDFGKPE
jgi:hypothetical protein